MECSSIKVICCYLCNIAAIIAIGYYVTKVTLAIISAANQNYQAKKEYERKISWDKHLRECVAKSQVVVTSSTEQETKIKNLQSELKLLKMYCSFASIKNNKETYTPEDLKQSLESVEDITKKLKEML